MKLSATRSVTNKVAWTVKLSSDAAADFARALRWTLASFGARQARAYEHALRVLVSALEAGPHHPRSISREEMGAGWRTLHLRAVGQRGRHFLLYRVETDIINVVRILHDSMDVARHLPPENDNQT